MLGADGELYPFGNAPRFSSAGPYAAAVTPRSNGTGVWVVDFFGHVHWYRPEQIPCRADKCWWAIENHHQHPL